MERAEIIFVAAFVLGFISILVTSPTVAFNLLSSITQMVRLPARRA